MMTFEECITLLSEDADVLRFSENQLTKLAFAFETTGNMVLFKKLGGISYQLKRIQQDMVNISSDLSMNRAVEAEQASNNMVRAAIAAIEISSKKTE